MIGMMYLVLTAMLALNVSADILNGFNKLRHSMESSIKSTDDRTDDMMKTFEAAYNKDEGGKAKYGPWLEIARSNKKMSDDLYNYIEQFKLDIVNMVEGTEYTSMPEEIKNGSDTNKPHQYAINEKDPSGRTHAQEFRVRMDAYRQYLSSADSECIQGKMRDVQFAHEWEQKCAMCNTLFSTGTVTNEEGESIPWEQSIFEEMPAGAVFALLTKYQSDIRMAENDWLTFWYKTAGSSDFVINSVQALILPDNGEYIMQGNHYRARIVSAAVDTTNLPMVYINGQEYADGVYDLVANQVGQHTYSGYMLMPGDTTHYTFTGQYTVGAPSASISNVDMNTIYTGYENKFNISVPGMGGDKIRVSATGASVSQKGGLYIIKPNEGAKTVKISVSAEIDGKVSLMGSNEYKVKPLPKPSAFLISGSETYDGTAKIGLKALKSGDAHLEASYGPEGVLDLPFTIVSFEIYANGRYLKAEGNKFSADMKTAIGKMRANDILSIMTIKYREPSGKVNTLPNLTLGLK
ncbi:MAG: gliding motility protein GldM [Paludibacteraceae bacterium]|nr:gliding motility protein GldM [Paludibacteraceae bacterium]